MTRFIFFVSLISLGNAIETGECVLGSEASCAGPDSSVLLQGRMRVNQDVQAKDADCTADDDSNCCFTTASALFADTVVGGADVPLAGDCAAGAKAIAGDQWAELFTGLEKCTTDVCTNHAEHPGSGTCADYTCSADNGFVQRTAGYNAAAPCTNVQTCEYNCCEVDVNADPERRNGIIVYSAIWAVANATRISNDIMTHGSADVTADLQELSDSTEALYGLMHQVLDKEKADEGCPLQAGSSFTHLTYLKDCVDKAMCVLAKNERSEQDTKDIAMLREYYAKFADITWDHLWEELNGEKAAGGESPFENTEISFVDAADLACEGLGDLANDVSLLETGAKAAAYRTSQALVDAARVTHAVLDSHRQNSSVSATIAALHRAWEPPCKLLNCDHTNYWDLLGASHAHSIALLESGANSHHMNAHIRTRARLEHRMQHFISSMEGRKLVSKIYRVQGTKSEAQMHRYGSILKDSLASRLANHPKKYGLDYTLLSLHNRDEMKKHFRTPLQSRLLQAFLDRNMYIVEDESQLADLAEIQTLSHQEDLSEEDEKRLEQLIHKSLIFKAIGNFFQDAGKAIVSVAETVGGAVVSAAETIGNGIATAATVVANGVATAATHVANGVVAVATTVANGVVEAGKAIGEGIVTGVTALGEAVITVATAIGTAIVAFVDFIISLLSCLGFGTVCQVGYGKKFPCPPVPPCLTTIGVTFALAVSVGTALKDLLKGIVVSSVGIGIGVGIGFVPGDSKSGGIRIGLGIALNLYCTATSCRLEIAVGAVASAILPLSFGSPRCVLGPTIWLIFTISCMECFGITLKLLCCYFDLTNGCQSCGSGGCEESNPSADSATQAKVNAAIAAGAGTCDESKAGNGAAYRGCQTRSTSGRECMKWSSQYPHAHNQNINANGLGDHNMCRNPDGHPTIWCYTKDPSKRWENCNTFEISLKTYVEAVDRTGAVHASGGTQAGHTMTMHACTRTSNYPNCQWYMEESATRYGFFYMRGSDRQSFAHAAGGTQPGNTNTMHQCWKGNNYPNCQWHIEPSTTRSGKYYIRGSDRSSFLHASGGTQNGHTLTMHACTKGNDYPNCQWTVSEFKVKMYLTQYFIAIDRDTSVHASGGTQAGHTLTMHACTKANNYPNCMWNMEESETRSGMYYLRGSDRQSFAHASGGTQAGHTCTMHQCWKGSNYPNCQWAIEASQSRAGKYYFKGSDRASYLHASGGTQGGHTVTMHQCWKGNNYPNCQWSPSNL